MRKLKALDRVIYITALTLAIIAICVSIVLIFKNKSADELSNNETVSQVTFSKKSGYVLGDATTEVIVAGYTCGNGSKEPGEDCDGSDLNSKTCISQGYDGGTLSCNANCTFNTSQCTTASEYCGDGIKQTDEECDNDDLDNSSCVLQGFDAGSLDCYNNCTFDKSGCYNYYITSTTTTISSPGTTTTTTTTSADTTDTDGDGLPDSWEKLYSCMNYRLSDASEDFDNDSLINTSEYNHDCDPCNADTDNDGLPDAWEIEYGLNPNIDDSSGDPDNDGFTNLQEYQNSTNPLVSDKQESSSQLPETGDERRQNNLILIAVSILGVVLTAVFLTVIILRKSKKQTT